MKFEEALKAMRDGKKVRLKDCGSSVSIGLYDGNIYWFSKGNHGSSPAMLSSNAIMLEEWEIFNESSIEKIVELLNNAKSLISLHIDISVNDHPVEDIIYGIDQAIRLLQENE